MGEAFITRRGGASGGSNTSNKAPMFQYTGTYSLTDDVYEPIDQGVPVPFGWKLRFLDSGVLIFSDLGSAAEVGLDVFLVGGGGTTTQNNAESWIRGGAGGYTTNGTYMAEVGVSYSITIGAGGKGYAATGGASSAFRLTAAGANKYDGGSGGGYYYSAAGVDGADGTGGTGQHSTTREFGEAAGRLYASGANYGNQANGAPNTGDGTGLYTGSGQGGSGIVVIRAHKEVI